VGLLFFQRIHSFEATNGSGGMMRHSGRYSRNVFIALAPYCLPVYTYVLLVFRLVIIPDFIPFFDVPVGVSFAFHAFAVKRDLSPRQTDIKDCGILFSYLFIAAFIFFNAAIIFRTISIGFAGAFSGWRNDFLFLFYKVSAGF
jgi:hypothetical protein